MAIEQAVDGEAWGVTGTDCKWWLGAKPDAEPTGGALRADCVGIARSGSVNLAHLREMAQVGPVQLSANCAGSAMVTVESGKTRTGGDFRWNGR
jgi:hypothetical protein